MLLRGVLSDAGECPYLPNRRFRAFLPHPNPPTGLDYQDLMNAGFRRSGPQVYKPMCEGCSACQSLRVWVPTFAPRTDQRRVWRRNTDLVMTWTERGADQERMDLYHRYEAAVHGKTEENDPTSFFTEDGGIPGGELHARDAQGRLVAVSVCDRTRSGLSSVYCYYDPDLRNRALGTCMAIAEIAYAAGEGIDWWYPGFHVAGCQKMEYKARFGPAEVLTTNGWRPFTQPGKSGPT